MGDWGSDGYPGAIVVAAGRRDSPAVGCRFDEVGCRYGTSMAPVWPLVGGWGRFAGMLAGGERWRWLVIGSWSDIFVASRFPGLSAALAMASLERETAQIARGAATGFQIVADPVSNVAERFIRAPKARIRISVQSLVFGVCVSVRGRTVSGQVSLRSATRVDA